MTRSESGPRWSAAKRACALVALAVLLGGCVVDQNVGGSEPPGSPAPSYLQGGVNNGGGDVFNGTPDDGPHTPRAATVGFFEPAQHATLALGDIEGQLQNEGYQEPSWFDTDGTVVRHELATLAEFKGLAHDGIAVVDAFGDDEVVAVETFCSPFTAVEAIHKYDQADLDAGDVEITAIPGDYPGDPTCGSDIDHDKVTWTNRIQAGDADPIPVHFPASVADPGRVKWAIGVTHRGLLSYLGQGTLSLLFLSSCDGATLAKGLSVDTVFSYAGCRDVAADLKTLFDALYGLSGIDRRATDTAFGPDKPSAIDYQQFGGPVLLSPAVVAIDPPEHRYLPPGTSTQVTVRFDTQMAQVDVAAIESGCDATIDGSQTWNGDRTKLQFKVKVGDHPKDNRIVLRIDADKATADATSGWPNTLAGNTKGDETNGQGPNDDDYVWQLDCVQSLDLSVDGLFDDKHVEGRLVGQGSEPPRVTCIPVVGFDGTINAMHVQVWGVAEETGTTVAADWTAKVGTSPIGFDVGDSILSFDMSGTPQRHIGGVSGTVTATPSGGSIDARGVDGQDVLHIAGSWTCDQGGSPAP